MTPQHTALTALLALSLTACGGSGSSATDDGTTQAPPKSRVTGPITGFGSVIVNGRHYDTDGTSFEVDDASATEQDLEVGMVVTLESDGAGQALRVSYDAKVEGPLSSLDAAAGQLVVLGQRVLVDDLTNWENTTLETVQVGDFLEVSGSVNASGDILASYVERGEPESEVEVEGEISQLNEAEQSFRINLLTVDYASASLFDVPQGQLSDGLLVEVEGQLDEAGVLIASSVEAEDRYADIADDEEVEISGVIGNLDGSRFSIDGLDIVFDSRTEFDDGSAEDLRDGARVEVEGFLNDQGELLADSIEFELEPDNEFEAAVESVDLAASSFTLLGGISFLVTADTRMEDDSERGTRQFDISDIEVGDRLEVSAANRDGTLVALMIEREDEGEDDDGDGRSDGSEISGVIESLNEAEQRFVLQGVTVQITETTEFEDHADSADFFSRSQPGDRISAEGSYDAGAMLLLAEEVEED